jgi:hypothetical protein
MLHRNAGLALAVATGFLLAAPLGGTERDDTSPPPVGLMLADAPLAHCCFTNPRFVGTCDVVPSADETCGSILAYLNNPQSQGKAYCGSTSIRGDWKAATCEAKPSGS